MLAASIGIKIVSDTLGQSDTRIMHDIYRSVLPRVGRSAAEATANLVPPAEGREVGPRATPLAGNFTAPQPCAPPCPEQQKTPGHGLCDLGFF